ncbi:MAG: polyprenol monophosphomannose synthase [Thermoplasmata archaeon]|nr:polyprenol monophosphomannose synthase [Thermoplasmata archaeon]
MPAGCEVSVILPTLQEHEALGLLRTRIDAALLGYAAEVIVVDDDSRDGTSELVAAWAAPPPHRLLLRRGVRGLGSAVVEGFRSARGDILVVMDADGSHPPELLPQLIDPIRRGEAAFVIGSRLAPGGSAPGLSAVRRLISRSARRLARPLTKVSDPMSGFFAVRREALSLDHLAPVGYKIALEVLVKSRPSPVLEVPFVFGPRLAGTSKLDRRQMGLYLRHLGRLYLWRARGRGRALRTR